MNGWLKLHNEIIHDPKIRSLAFEDRWHFVALLCLKNDGTLDEDPEIVSDLVEIALGLHGKDLENLKKRLMRLRLIAGNWGPVNFDKRQQSKDATAAERMRKYRENKKKKTSDVTLRVTGDEHAASQLRIEEEVEEESIPAFAGFWDAYQKKKDKADAEKAWSKLSGEEKRLAFTDVKDRANSDPEWLKQNRQFQPYAGVYLRNRRWEDEWQSGDVGDEDNDFDWDLVE